MNYTHVQKVRLIYKSILRLHKGLPEEMQLLGTKYVKEEFKKHKNCTSQQAAVFIHEWANYALILAKQLNIKGPNTRESIGKQLSEEDLELFKDDQINQLYELMLVSTRQNGPQTTGNS